MTQIRLKIIADIACKPYEDVVKNALEELRKDYYAAHTDHKLDLKYDIEYRDLARVPWVYYTVIDDHTGQAVKDKYMGFDFGFLKQDTKMIWDAHGWAYDCAVYVVDKQNWRTEHAWGWNVGGFWNNYQVQIVRGDGQNQRGMYLTFSMELHHALDDFIFAELATHIETTLGVDDYDRDVTHGLKNPPYVVFQYQNSISIMRDWLIQAFEKRAKRHLISLIQFYLTLLRQLLAYYTSKKAEPILKSEVEGRHEH